MQRKFRQTSLLLPDTVKNGTFASPAVALAKRVFPVEGFKRFERIKGEGLGQGRVQGGDHSAMGVIHGDKMGEFYLRDKILGV